MNKFLIPILLMIFCMNACNCSNENEEKNDETENQNTESDFGKAIIIDSLHHTDFVATLGNTIPKNNNVIYAPTLLFAYNEIRKQMPDIHVAEDKGTEDIMKLNDSKSFKNSLDTNEYKTEISITDEEIKAKASFNIHLSFDPVLKSFPLYFKGERVEGFGMEYYDKELVKNINILYYQDDDNFIFSIRSKEDNNELIFVKGLLTADKSSLAKIISTYESYTMIGKDASKSKKDKWKYAFKDGENMEIPKLNFNLEKNYKTIEGQQIVSKNKWYDIIKAYQRTALKLDETGAIVESDAEMSACTAAIDSIPAPFEVFKHFILDNTFFLIIKHTDQLNPYFVMKVDNTELMKKLK
jgi:hypothetical protein